MLVRNRSRRRDARCCSGAARRVDRSNPTGLVWHLDTEPRQVDLQSRTAALQARDANGGTVGRRRITIVDEMVRNRGGITHLEWTGKFDGIDYPVQGVELVLTNAYRRVDDRTYELIQKIDGEVVATSRLTMSPDGRTITTVNSSKTASATTIYERQ